MSLLSQRKRVAPHTYRHHPYNTKTVLPYTMQLNALMRKLHPGLKDGAIKRVISYDSKGQEVRLNFRFPDGGKGCYPFRAGAKESAAANALKWVTQSYVPWLAQCCAQMGGTYDNVRFKHVEGSNSAQPMDEFGMWWRHDILVLGEKVKCAVLSPSKKQTFFSSERL